jgi:hypothetical protein
LFPPTIDAEISANFLDPGLSFKDPLSERSTFKSKLGESMGFTDLESIPLNGGFISAISGDSVVI